MCDTMETSAVEGEQIEYQETPESSTPSNFELILNDPLLLQDLVLKEKEREYDQDINLEHPLEEPCQLVEWNRLRRILFSNRIDIRVKFTEDPIVLVMRLIDLSYDSTGIRDITNWEGVPSFVKDLIEPEDSSEGVGGYAILNYDTNNGWVLLGCLAFDSPAVGSDDSTQPLENSSWSPAIPAISPDISFELEPEPEPEPTSESPSIEPNKHQETATSLNEEHNVGGSRIKRRFRAFKLCPVCKTEVQNRSFKSHLAIHDPTKWARCLHCNFTSHRIENIIRHTERNHPRAKWIPMLSIDGKVPTSTSPSQEVPLPTVSEPEMLIHGPPSVQNEEPTPPLTENTFQTPIPAELPSQIADDVPGPSPPLPQESFSSNQTEKRPEPNTKAPEMLIHSSSPSMQNEEPPLTENTSQPRIPAELPSQIDDAVPGPSQPVSQQSSASTRAKQRSQPRTKSKKGLKGKGKNKIALYECDICNEKFHLRWTHKRHKKIHDPLQKKKCDQCFFSTSSDEELQQHILLFHPEVDPEIPDDISTPSATYYSSSDEDSTTDTQEVSSSKSDTPPSVEEKKIPVRRRESKIPISKDWLCCPHCDYKSHRPDFLQIHLERAYHVEEKKTESSRSSTEASTSHPIPSTSRGIKRRRISSSSSSTSSNHVNVTSSDDETLVSYKPKLRSQVEHQKQATASGSPVKNSKQNGIECPTCKESIAVEHYNNHAAEHKLAKLKQCPHCDYTSARQDLVDSHISDTHPLEAQLNVVSSGNESDDSTQNYSQDRGKHSISQSNQLQNLVCRVAPQIGSPRPANDTEDPEPSTSMSHDRCSLCDMILTDIGKYGNTLANHMELHRKVPDLGSFFDLILPCEKCHYVSITHDNLIRHVGKHHQL